MGRKLVILFFAAGAAAAAVYGFVVKPTFATNEQLDLNQIVATVHEKFPDVEHIDTNGVKAKLADTAHGPVQIIDVREPKEYAVSHLPGALNIPPDTTDEELLKIVKPDGQVIVYCSVGWRSSILAQRLKAAGRSNVANYAGSIFAWANADQPLQSSAGDTAKVHPYDANWGRYLKPEHRGTP